MVTPLLVVFLATAQLSSAQWAWENPDGYTKIFTPEQLEARSLKRFTRSHADNANCWNRSVEMDGFISPVDTHNHFRPFGGPPVPFEMYLEWMREHGILFTTMFGIGQKMRNKNDRTKQKETDCCYYGHCPTLEYMVVPEPENDIANAEDYQKYKKNDTQMEMIHLTLSATYPNLQSPEEIMTIYDEKLAGPFPGAFQWAGEINVFKHALAPNGFFSQWPRVNVATVKGGSYDAFFKRMLDNKSPITLHCDLGCDVTLTRSKTQWKLQTDAYNTLQRTCTPDPTEVQETYTIQENVDFWKRILTRNGVSHYNGFFDRNTKRPKENFIKIQHLQVWYEILARYPDNIIVWAHLGLSKELRTLHPQVHSDIMANLFDEFPNLHADVSWDILAKLLLMNYNGGDTAEQYKDHEDVDTATFLYNHTHVKNVRQDLHDEIWDNHKAHIARTASDGKKDSCKKGICGPTHALALYLTIFEEFSERFVTGTDFVASYGTKREFPGQKMCPAACPSGCVKDKTNHARQVTDTNSINIFLSDKAFKQIVLGENYFRITGLDSTYAPPAVCGATEAAGVNIGIIVGILVGLVVLLLITVGICCYIRNKEPENPSTAGMTVTSGAQEAKSGATTAV